MPQILKVPFDSQEIGQGFNSDTHENVGTAVTFASVHEDPLADGQTVTTQFQIVSTQDSLMESLGIQASVDARYMLFSGGAKVNFAESHAVNSFSSFIAGQCLVINAIRHGDGPALTSNAQALVTSQQLDVFKTAFGDMFVRSLKTGGEFNVVARITSVSEEHQRNLAASLQAEYQGLAVAVSFSVAFTQAMTETHNQTEVTVFMQQSGGIGGQASFTGPDATKILDRLSQFPQSVHDHPIAYEVEVASYNTIPIPVPTPEERADRELVLQDCAQQKQRFLAALSDIQLALDQNGPNLFDNLPPQNTLSEMESQYRVALNGLIQHAIQVATGRMDPPQVYVATPPVPPVTFVKKPFVAPPPPPPPMVVLPDFTQIPAPVGRFAVSQLAAAEAEVDRLGLHFTLNNVSGISGPELIVSGAVTAQTPLPGTNVEVGSTVTLQI